MAQSSKFAKIDKDVLLEFIYHDHSIVSGNNPAKIENDDNGSQLKIISTPLTSAANTTHRYLIHELGGSVVHFTVSISSGYVLINGFASRALILKNGNTYKFDVSSLDNIAGFILPNSAVLSGNVYTYTPNSNGTYNYEYTDLNNVVFIGGSISVGNKANSLYSTPYQQTGNNIETASGQSDRYQAITTGTANKYALLDNNTYYLGSDEWSGTNITTFNNVVSYTDVQHVYYDTIRLHLRSGYSFSARNYEGFMFQVKTKDTSGNDRIFTSITYLNESSFEIQNPTPFTMGDAMYSKYIEVKVPSLSVMDDAAKNVEFRNKFFSAAGFFDNTLNYEIDFNLIGSISDESHNVGVNTQTISFINVVSTTSMIIPREDEYGNISVSVDEPSGVDYFEIYGIYNGSASGFEGYVNERIQLTSDDISVFYEIEVSEQISTNYISTYKTTFVQTSQFDKPILFRPVIMHANISNSFLLRVTMRIYNETDNTQIVKVGTVIHNRPRKYGKSFERINMKGITKPIIYNRLPNTIVNRELNSFINSIRPTVGETKYVPVPLEKRNISVSANTPTISGDVSGDVKFEGLGECVLRITRIADSNIMFTIANLNNNTYSAIDLVGADRISLVLNVGTSNVKIPYDPTITGANLSNGEVVFKITKSVVVSLGNNEINGTFYITMDHGVDNSSVLYDGKIIIV